jgi:hypothetical protein
LVPFVNLFMRLFMTTLKLFILKKALIKTAEVSFP